MQEKMKKIIAIVGMPGAGKSEAAAYFKKKNIPVVRFGDLAEETLKQEGLSVTPENERAVRERLRKELGMEAFAIKAKPKIDALLAENELVVLDGLYSWEEYVYLIKYFPDMVLVHIYASPRVRYARLSKRAVRPLSPDQARARDMAEIEHLHKAGPIVIADYLIMNEKGIDSLNDELRVFLDNLVAGKEMSN